MMTAYILGQHEDIDVDVYEGATRFAEIGAGIGVGWRPWAVLKELGLEESLLKFTIGTPSDGVGKSFELD